ncbi:hypothetical protein PHYBLDRAFT_64850 [Phycomyces blakesleeanus NRRL 1555(-)]|uniref:Uncharacterized protein n=1 Tax=Phycomyces blakesleeanus (strain ATCC 8743b / DSM 1359 / FGSC 10004 / NBRC 33097 / NRRL 1555) TaxID=763407 RepID=A0A162PTV7_PHYB8|nr:hypothetical protein PHYBLDRAFT_64850 [Phycomyces blakesleeanus NRRL 1555(-)]OAD73896.1 hypothetical protein PHYBLDRAFT_64850 [Phycomyces blakesleeanus NRRL 1555(-)]|eukprot:XP_018291936.1 hypothetical protein PHYBLDRAFT_64850 [Phycomyces blakesleeanus NRRL 1555(-)]
MCMLRRDVFVCNKCQNIFTFCFSPRQKKLIPLICVVRVFSTAKLCFILVATRGSWLWLTKESSRDNDQPYTFSKSILHIWQNKSTFRPKLLLSGFLTVIFLKNVNRHLNYFNGVEFHEFLFSEEDEKMSLSEHCALKINFIVFSFNLTPDVDSRILLTATHDRKQEFLGLSKHNISPPTNNTKLATIIQYNAKKENKEREKMT